MPDLKQKEKMNFKKILVILFSIGVAFATVWILPADCPDSARRMVFIFVIAALFWALELIPLFATAILVVLLEIFLLAGPGKIPGVTAKVYTDFFSPFSNPVIMLFLGGFVLAGAFRKYEIDRWLAVHLLRYFGNQPFFVLLGFMATTAILSMWISNTATTALMIAMIHPLLSKMKTNDAFRKALVLAIAFAAGIGGVATPIGTPPNAVAIGLLAERGIHVNFLSWMTMAFPLACLLILVACVLLYFIFPSAERRIVFPLDGKIDFSFKKLSVAAIAGCMILLWLSSGWHRIPESVTALLGVCLLSVSRLIDVEDLKRIDWDILVLMWGGLALGDGMEASGLAHWLIGLPIFARDGFELVVIFCVVAVLLSTFISNTATVNLLIPIALSIPGENPIMLATVIALASSFDIALPMATPPMAMAYGTRQITVKDMLKVGILFTVIANVLVLAGFEFVIGRTLLK